MLANKTHTFYNCLFPVVNLHTHTHLFTLSTVHTKKIYIYDFFIVCKKMNNRMIKKKQKKNHGFGIIIEIFPGPNL